MKKILLLLSALFLAHVLVAQDSSVTRTPFRNQVKSPARAGATAILKPAASSFVFGATNLPPGRRFQLQIGNMTVGQFVSDPTGRAQVAFSTDTRPGFRRMRFDPRGKTITVRQGAATILKTGIAAPGETAGTTGEERAQLTRLAGTGTAKARYTINSDRTRRFKVQLSGVTGTNWLLFVNGISRGAIRTTNGVGELSFSSDKPNYLGTTLDFDPREQVIDIAQDETLMFTGKLAAKAKNVNVATPTVQYFTIPRGSAGTVGSAKAKLRLDSRANRDFSVELEDVPEGSYQLLANGVLTGTIVVSATENGTEGEVEFSVSDADEDHLPLTFDPLASSFTIRKDNIVYFQGPLARVGGSATFTGPLERRENLVSTGLVPGASGDAELKVDDRGRADFSVEIEDVAAGSYGLWIGGAHRGDISAQLINGAIEGELEFSTRVEPGELPLNFDPRGQLIEVKSAEGILFSHIFGEGGTNGPAGLPPVRVEVPLFNSGVTPAAFAKMKFKRDEDGQREFEVEAQGLALGDYELLVGGTMRGTISVVPTATGTRGQLEFDDDADDAGEVPLTFDPKDQEVIIRRDNVDYFMRTLVLN